MTHPFVTFRVTADELVDGALAPDRLAATVESLRTLGAAVILDAVDLDVCDRLLDAMLADLDAAAAKPPSLDIRGHVQHTPPPRAEHLHVEVFANPIALSIVRALLGRNVQLALYTGNTMLAGTTDAQPVHWDEHQLWPALETAPPAASVTVNIPLVDVTVENGAIELWPGTHLDVRSGDRTGQGLLVPDEWLDARRSVQPPVRVPVPRGALLLRDGRMWHRGTTNATDAARPMVAMVYSAAWARPYAIDFHPDARPIVDASGVRVLARYRESFDHLDWPPSWEIVAKPVD